MTTTIEAAAAVGVVLGLPFGEITPSGDRLRVGSIVVADDGITEAIPRLGVDEDTREQLLTAAVNVAIRGRENPRVWKYDPRLGWVACFTVRRPPEEAQLAEQASALLSTLGQLPALDRRHSGFYVRLAARCSMAPAEIARRLGVSEDEVRRELAAGGQ